MGCSMKRYIETSVRLAVLRFLFFLHWDHKDGICSMFGVPGAGFRSFTISKWMGYNQSVYSLRTFLHGTSYVKLHGHIKVSDRECDTSLSNHLCLILFDRLGSGQYLYLKRRRPRKSTQERRLFNVYLLYNNKQKKEMRQERNIPQQKPRLLRLPQ